MLNLKLVPPVIALCLAATAAAVADEGSPAPDYDKDGTVELGPIDPGTPDQWDPGDDDSDTDYDPDTGSTDDGGDDDSDDVPCMGAGPGGPGAPGDPGGPVGDNGPGGGCGFIDPGDDPEGNGPTPIMVDPGELAQRTLETLPLPAPEVHMAPAGMGGAPSLVNLPTWLWIDGGWGPLSKSATAGQTTVTVMVESVRVDYDMGAGSTSCGGPGTAWRGGNRVHSPSGCDFTYSSAGEYDTSAVIQFQADWTCSGFCLANEGTLGVVAGPASSSSVQVSERQSVVVD